MRVPFCHARVNADIQIPNNDNPIMFRTVVVGITNAVPCQACCGEKRRQKPESLSSIKEVEGRRCHNTGRQK